MKYSFMGVPDFRRIIDENANTPAMLVTSHGDAGVLLVAATHEEISALHSTPGVPRHYSTTVLVVDAGTLARDGWRFVAGENYTGVKNGTGLREKQYLPQSWWGIIAPPKNLRAVWAALKARRSHPPHCTVEPLC